MKYKILIPALTVMLGLGLIGYAQAEKIPSGMATMLAQYQAAGAGPFDAARGKAMWTEQHTDKATGQQRDCTSCHTADMKAVGKHKKTGKKIDPLAPSVNAERLTEVKKIKKWFKRNCKWTLGRECTPQEKGDFLSYINTQ